MNMQAKNKCPSCRTVGEMIYDEEKKVYRCGACDMEFTAAQLGDVGDSVAAYVSEAVRNISSPDAALIYLESYFDTFDFETYVTDTTIFIEDLKIMVEKNKINNPANCKTWQLEIESVVNPLNRKLRHLDDIQEKIAAKYNGDIATVADELSVYNSVAKAIVAASDTIKRILANDIENMKRFGSDPAAIEVAKTACDDMTKDLDSLVVSTDIKDLPIVKKRMDAAEKKQIAEYAANGINALNCYDSGKKAYEVANYADALAYFEQIVDFRDTRKYIGTINKCFSFTNLFEAGGKLFIIYPHRNVFGSSKGGCALFKKNSEPENPTMPEKITLDYHEIVDGIPVKAAAFTEVSQIVCTYGENIFYIKNDTELCVYNVRSRVITYLDASKYGYDLSDTNGFGYTFSCDKIYLRKILVHDAFANKGCALKKKFNEEEYRKSHQNNYTMLLVDLKGVSISVPIKEMIGCAVVRDYVFYTVSEFVSEDKKHRKTYETRARMHNFATGVTEKLFEKNCEILAVSGTKVIYDFWTPNRVNRELRVIDYLTKEDVLLEENIYDFMGVNDGKIYYRVGNARYSPLYAIDQDGTNRIEIMPNYSGKELIISCGWLYISSGSYLTKVALDGSKKIVVANNIQNIVKFSGSYLYYIDLFKNFRVVKLDGTDNILIADGIEADDISIGAEYVYYLRKEFVGGGYSKSLYRMDTSGHNAKKLLFNINKMLDKDVHVESADIYILKKENKTYKITTPGNEWYETFEISNYYTLNKLTGELKTILVLGVPNEENYYNMPKKGCWNKIKGLFKKTPDFVVIQEIIPEINYGQIDETGSEALYLAEQKAAEERAAAANGAKKR